jgi:DNA mismatch endonuclease (patch repair protein)
MAVRNVVFPLQRKAIHVSGCFWHKHSCGRRRIPAADRAYWIAKIDRNAARDRRCRRALRRAGWQVLTVWECQTISRRRDRLTARLEAFLASS